MHQASSDATGDQFLVAQELVARGEPLRKVHRETGIDRKRLRRFKAGDFELSRPGRRPLPDGVKAEARERLKRGQSLRTISQEMGNISAASVSRIRTGRKPRKAVSKLKRGEVRLATPQRCDAGHLVDIVPCRQCKVQSVLTKLGGLVRKANEIKQSAKRTDEKRATNDYQLTAGQQQRLDDIRARRATYRNIPTSVLRDRFDRDAE